MSDEQQSYQPSATPPANAAEATTRLENLKSSTDATTKLLAGDPYIAKEFSELHAMIDGGDNIELALSGALPDVPDSDLKQMSGTAEMLKSMGFPEKAVRETISNSAVTEADVQRATAWRTQALKSQDFADRLLRGEPDAARELLAANIVLSLPLKNNQGKF
jgi:hypothetical protein